jgi:hypothetical protein
MIWEVFIHWEKLPRAYSPYDFHFKYPLLEFVQPMSMPAMEALFVVLLVAAALVAVGLLYRLAAAVFCAGYTYMFLIEATEYNNHYYLICLLSFLMVFAGAHRWMSLDRLWLPEAKRDSVPAWNVFMIKAQLLIVYFFGGIAKLNPDWLRGEPMRNWLQERTDLPVFGSYLDSELAVWFFCAGGLVFDLAIGFLLWARRTRPFALPVLVFFHITNEWLFSIGIFPWMGIGSAVIFLEPETPRRVWNWIRRRAAPPKEERLEPARASKPILALLALYLSIQAAMPLRHYLYPGYVSWTEEGHYLSWHMKLRDKDGSAEFIVTDPISGDRWTESALRDVDARKAGKMAGRPDMILQYAHHLRDRLKAGGYPHAIIRVETSVSLNFREPQPIIDPSVDLARTEYRVFGCNPWILPLKE